MSNNPALAIVGGVIGAVGMIFGVAELAEGPPPPPPDLFSAAGKEDMGIIFADGRVSTLVGFKLDCPGGWVDPMAVEGNVKDMLLTLNVIRETNGYREARYHEVCLPREAAA